MSEFFVELFSEEIPARMQAAAAQELLRICGAAFAELSPANLRTFYGPRRIALGRGDCRGEAGWRDGGARAAGSARRKQRSRGSWGNIRPAATRWWRKVGISGCGGTKSRWRRARSIATVLAPALAKFAWPKSMRWGQGAEFTWVRPLRRVVCLLDGAVVPFSLGPVTAGNETEGHRVHGAGRVCGAVGGGLGGKTAGAFCRRGPGCAPADDCRRACAGPPPRWG